MKSRMFIILLALSLTSVAGAPRAVQRGNRLYNNEQYGRALIAYNRAKIDDPQSPAPYFNIGDVYYRQNNFAAAVEAFTNQLQRETGVTNRAAGYYNLGNTFYQMSNFQAAVDAYKECLRLTPGDADARYNLELAMRRLQQQQQQQTNQQQNSNQQQQNQQNSQQNNQQQNQQNSQQIPQQQQYSQAEAMRILDQLENNNRTVTAVPRGGVHRREQDW